MKCSELINTIDGLRYVIDALELSSGRVLRALMAQPMLTNATECEQQWSRVQEAYLIVCEPKNRALIDRLHHQFYQVQEIEKWLSSIGSKASCNDVELFELKAFTITIRDISRLLGELSYGGILLPDLEPVYALLDPDKTGVASFYVYDSYSEVLAAAREKLNRVKGKDGDTQWEQAQADVEQAEDAVRVAIMQRLVPFKEILLEAYLSVTQLEIIFAKAILARKWALTRPLVAQDLQVEAMTNPQVEDALEAKNRHFQRIDISLAQGPCLLTGANMSGKTVVLKTVALIQAMAQLGFFVPATKALIPVVDHLFVLVGDKQDSARGLSSFAAEMMAMNRVFEVAEAGKRLMVLMDEPARTTNPKEGAALLCALTDFFDKYHVRALISTHYGDLNLNCRRLRVVGFDAQKVEGKLDPKKINEFMDYSVVEDNREEVPMEALRIAHLLGVNPTFLTYAQQRLAQKDEKTPDNG